MLSILGGINHAETEEADHYRKLQFRLVLYFQVEKNGIEQYHKAKSEAYSPDAFRAVLMIACKDDQGDDTRSDEALKKWLSFC